MRAHSENEHNLCKFNRLVHLTSNNTNQQMHCSQDPLARARCFPFISEKYCLQLFPRAKAELFMLPCGMFKVVIGLFDQILEPPPQRTNVCVAKDSQPRCVTEMFQWSTEKSTLWFNSFCVLLGFKFNRSILTKTTQFQISCGKRWFSLYIFACCRSRHEKAFIFYELRKREHPKTSIEAVQNKSRADRISRRTVHTVKQTVDFFTRRGRINFALDTVWQSLAGTQPTLTLDTPFLLSVIISCNGRSLSCSLFIPQWRHLFGLFLLSKHARSSFKSLNSSRLRAMLSRTTAYVRLFEKFLWGHSAPRVDDLFVHCSAVSCGSSCLFLFTSKFSLFCSIPNLFIPNWLDTPPPQSKRCQWHISKSLAWKVLPRRTTNNFCQRGNLENLFKGGVTQYFSVVVLFKNLEKRRRVCSICCFQRRLKIVSLGAFTPHVAKETCHVLTHSPVFLARSRHFLLCVFSLDLCLVQCCLVQLGEGSFAVFLQETLILFLNLSSCVLNSSNSSPGYIFICDKK